MLYIEEPDTHGHAFGTNSEVVTNLIRKLDNVTRYLEVGIIFFFKSLKLFLPFCSSINWKNMNYLTM